MTHQKLAWTLRVLLVMVGLIVCFLPWRAHASPHFALELVAGLAGVLVFVVSLRARGTGGALVLSLGLAWLAAGTMDILHALFSVNWLVTPESAPDHFIPGSWTASRTALGALLLLVLIFREPLVRSGRAIVFLGVLTTVSLSILCLLFFAFTPLPSFIVQGFPVKRPWEAVPLLLYLVSLIELRRAKSERLRLLGLSLEGAIATQIAMLFAGSLFNGLFYAAHALKVASYALAVAALSESRFEIAEEERPLWARPVLSWICAALLLTLSLSVWWKMRAGEESRMWRTVDADLRRACDRITARLEEEVLALVRMAARWESEGRRAPDEVDADAIAYLDHMPALRTLAWAGPEDRVRWCMPPERKAATRSLLAAYNARETSSTGPEHASAARSGVFYRNEKGYLVLVPLRGKLRGGHLVAEFLAEEWLRNQLSDFLAAGVSLTVIDGDSEVFSSFAPGDPRPAESREARVELSGLDWVVRASLTPEFLARARSPVPTAAFSAGSAIAVLSFFVIRLVQDGQERSRALRESHAELVRENRRRKAAEEELERRVEERTIELTRANGRLQKEVAGRERAQEQIAERNRDLEALLYVTSHDLREPLRAIKSFSVIVKESYGERLDDRGQDLLGRIVRAATRMSQLLDDILALSRARTIKRPRKDIEAAEIVEEALARLASRIQESGARIRVAPDLPRLRADPTWATQAVYNLIANALKFTREGAVPDVEIDAYRPESGYGQVGLAVRDRGPGIEPRHADRIFDLFQRAVPREVEGTGAGLAIVRQVAERHGGRAWTRRRRGGGSEFVITFGEPRDEKPDEAKEQAEEKEENKEGVIHGSSADRDPPC